jgi:DNA-directed RNA polymerase specialized sigma24 family protein
MPGATAQGVPQSGVPAPPRSEVAVVRMVRAVARRSGSAWVVNVPAAGSVEAVSLSAGERAARDLAAAVFNVPAGQVQVSLTPKLGLDLGAEVTAAREASAELAQRTREVGAQSRRVVLRLRDLGLSNADIGAVMGISATRVSQLLGKAEQAAS